MIETRRLPPIKFTGAVSGELIMGVSVATTGEAAGHRLLFDEQSLAQLQQIASSKSGGIKSRFTHPDWFHDGLGKYLGRFRNFRVDGSKLVADLAISKTAHTSPASDIGKYVLDLATEDPGSFGVSVVIDLDRVWPTRDGQERPAAGGRPDNATTKMPVARITQLYAADLVDEPALNPNGLFRKISNNLNFYTPEEAFYILHPEALPSQEGEQAMPDLLFNSDSIEQPVTPVVTPPAEEPDRLARLESNLAKLHQIIEDRVITIGGQPPRGQSLSLGATAREQFQGYFDWLFGAPSAKLPPPELRRADALYRAVTGDVDMKGVFDPSHVALAAATTTTLADLAVNAMNKVVLDLYTNLTAYRWYELITAVQATDGSLQDMQWLQFGGIG
ncbi:MAG TPA: hypothetical protein VF831_08295, partial [Anaerolineales bacterium]